MRITYLQESDNQLEVEGRRPVGRPKKTWSKVVKEDMRKLNITEDIAEDRQQQRQLIIFFYHTQPQEWEISCMDDNEDDDDRHKVITVQIQ